MASVMLLVINAAKAALGLGIVIFVHELGHFLLAKLCGVKCEKFYIGFDAPIKIGPWQLPSSLFRRRWGETEYGIGIIPLGGYVKMLGQDDNPANATKEAERIKVPSTTHPSQGAETTSTPSDQRRAQLDPRSYPAKSVIQRMMIISAGVIFNLIFGVIFAAIAYGMGVSYIPTRIGGTLVGETAWRAGLKAGDKIIQIDGNAPESEELRFDQDLRVRLALSDAKDITLGLKSRDGEKRQVVLSPRNRKEGQAIGVIAASDTTIADLKEGSIAEQKGLKPGDKIEAVTVNGKTIKVDGDGILLSEVLATHPRQTVQLDIVRVDEKSKEASTPRIELPPMREMDLGLHLTMGPITAVQSGSPADRAGLKEGDVIRSLNGKPIENPRALSTMIVDLVGQSVRLGIQRGSAAELIEVELIPTPPQSLIGHVMHRDAPIGLDPIGIGFVVEPIVAGVVPGSSADKAGIQVGDRLVSSRLVAKEIPEGLSNFFKRKRIREFLKTNGVDEPVEHAWPHIEDSVVQSDVSFAVALTYQQGSETKIAELVPSESNDVFDASRGIGLKPASALRKANSIGEAFSLGLREIQDGLTQVVTVLRKIGKSYKKLGGPIAIATIATGEASQGLPRLLLFLTMLSANLAVINFLPIPVLDGGHMVFLAYEGIFGKPVNERVALGLTLIGFSLLMGLMVFVLGLDIHNFLL